jgi:hypothetical protein
MEHQVHLKIMWSNIRCDEETEWSRHAMVKHVQEGGNNTKYFHLVTNRRHRKKNNFQLEQMWEKETCMFILPSTIGNNLGHRSQLVSP